MITDKDFDFVAQNSHVLGGALGVLGPVALWGNWAQYAGALAIFSFAVVKEFWWDETYETPEVRGSSLRDFLFYCVGIILALIALRINL